MITDEQRAAWQVLADAATEAPWTAEYSGEQGNCVLPPDARSTREAVAVTRLLRQQADAEFIAAAREAVPTLLAALRETEAERDALARRIEAVRDILAATRPQYSPLGVECPETAHGLHARVAAALDGEDGTAPRAIPADREVIQYGPTPDQLDEVVLSNVDVHIEQMDTNWYWMCFQRGENRLVIHLGADRAPVNGTVIEDDLDIRRTP